MTDVLSEPGSASSITQFSSSDLEEVRYVLNRFFYPVAIGAPDGAETFRFSADVIRLGPLTLGRVSFGGVTTLASPELDAYHVTMPTSGHCYGRQAGREVTASSDQAAVFGPGNPVFTMQAVNTAELDVKIERSALEADLSAMLDHPVRRPLDMPQQIDVAGGLGRRWRRIAQLIHHEAEHSDGLLRHPLIVERIRHLITNGLLYTVPHRYREELLAPSRRSSPRAIRRVQQVVEAEPERAYSVAELALIAGVSVRSLQDGFRRHLGLTPMAYLQQVRLRRAHEALRAADPAVDTVSAIAYRWGFTHLGRFASAYRARYAESPSATLKRSSHGYATSA